MRTWSIVENMLLLMGLSFLSQSCMEVELCDTDLHPHRTVLDFRYHWAENYQLQKTDSMKVVAIRPVNILRYEFKVTSKAEGNQGNLISPEGERQSWIYDVSDGQNRWKNDYLWVRPGNYKFVSYTVDSGMMGDGLIGSQEDENAVVADFSDLYFSYRPFKVTDSQIKDVFGSWKTHNTYTDYVSGKVKPVFFAQADYVDIPMVQDLAQTAVIDFFPKPVTQHVSFGFILEKEAGIVVDSVTAEIAGVPATIELATGLLHPEKTYKMLFRMYYPALQNREDSAQASRLECHGNVDLTGIIRSVSENMQTGPGILQLAVYSHVTEEADGNMPSRTFQKIFYAGINLFYTLTENKLLEWEEDEGKYSQTCHEAAIEIGDVLKLSKDKVLDGGSGSTGLDKWFDGEDIDLDI